MNFNKTSEIDKLTIKLAELSDLVRTVVVEHKGVMQDQDLLAKRVDKNSDEIRTLQTATAKIDTVSNLAKYGGLALITAIIVSWNTLSGRVDTTTAKTEANAQTIVQLKADNDDTQKQLGDMQRRITENRESIITQLNAKQDKNHEK